MKRIFAALLLMACVSPLAPAKAAAQQQRTTVQTLIPDTTVQRVIALYNREATTRFTGETRIAAGTSVTGDVASLGGPLEIGGHVTGDVVVINGDVHLLATAVVDGTVTAAGGSVRVEPGARTGKDVASYREMLRLRVEDDRLEYVQAPLEPGISAGYDFPFGRTDLLLAVRGSYNRAEGLPIAFGPRATLGTSTPTRLQALAIYRTARGLEIDPNHLGYFLAVDQYLNRKVRLEGRLYREIQAIEDWDLSNREASLAAFILHRDYRDHYERRGWSAGIRMKDPGSPLELSLGFRDETNRSVGAADPVALTRNGEEWRHEPLIAEGRLQSVTAAFGYDTRNDIRDPADGWYIRGSIEQGLGGSLEPLAITALPASVQTVDEFTAALVDIRRYARITPYSRLALRVIAGGSLDGGPLPAQRQQTLGGAGSLPAYPHLAFDCGARATTVERDGTFYPFHGCDRMAIMQVEYQASFPFASKVADELGLGSWLTNSVRWSAFFDAGRAWTEAESRNGRTRGTDDFKADAGLGLRLGPLGLYWAVPLSRSEHQFNFFVRLGPRL